MGRSVAGEPGLPGLTTEQATKLACLAAKLARNSYHARPRRPPSLRAAAGSLARGQPAMMRFTLCEPSAHRYQAAQGLNTAYQNFYTAVEVNAALSLSLRVLLRARNSRRPRGGYQLRHRERIREHRSGREHSNRKSIRANWMVSRSRIIDSYGDWRFR